MSNDFNGWAAARGARDAAAHQVLTRCPVCGDDLRIVRLECPACGSALQGNFTLGRLARLTREQLQFVEVFIRCRGKIKDVEEELGISYPTVVARLNEVVQAMGFEVRQEDADLVRVALDPRSHWFGGWECRAKLYVPRDIRAGIETSAGSVSVRDLEAC